MFCMQNQKCYSRCIYCFKCNGESLVYIISFAPTLPPPPVTPKVVQDLASEGSKVAHETPLVFFMLISTLVVRALYFDCSGSIVYIDKESDNVIQQNEHLSTYMEQGDCLLIALIVLHLDINGQGLLLKSDLGIKLVLCKDAQNDMGLGLVPICPAIHKLFLLFPIYVNIKP